MFFQQSLAPLILGLIAGFFIAYVFLSYAQAPGALLHSIQASEKRAWMTSVSSFLSRDTWCHRNPYLSDWGDAQFTEAADAAMAFRASENRQGLEKSWHAPKWGRFDAAPGTVPCGRLEQYPRTDDPLFDGSKWLCDLEILEPGCIIYSLGSNAQFDFEYAVAAATPCEVYSFDCTVATSRIPEDLNERGLGRVHFLPWCVGDVVPGNDAYVPLPEIAARLNHSRIDVLKMDVEGFEYRVMEGLFTDALANGASLAFLPMQISFELHLDFGLVRYDALSAADALVFWNQLVDLGYSVVSREDNPIYHGGAEFTALRTFC
jgi:hypothetical protein